MSWRASAALRNSCLDAVNAAINGGPGPGQVRVYTGTRPATPDAAATGTLLGTCVMSDPALGTPSGGAVVANTISNDISADANGTAGYVRVTDSNGNGVLDG